MSDEAKADGKVEVISRCLSGMRFAAAAQEDEGVRIVSDIEAEIVVKALAEQGYRIIHLA